MPRRRVIAKREVLADPKYLSIQLSKFINVIMVSGKKSIAEKIVYGALDHISVKGIEAAKKIESIEDSSSGLEMLTYALQKIKPKVEVKSKRVGGATYQVPIEVRDDRGIALSMRWIIEAARKRNEKGMTLRLACEILDILSDKGNSLKKKEDSHKMAKANQAFAHFRFN